VLSIKWKDELMSVGNEEIDKQHKTLIGLINKIIHSIQNGNQINDLEKFVAEAVAYTTYHFSSEEEHFEKICDDQEEIRKHKIRHQEFIDKVTQFSNQIKENKNIKSAYGIELVTQLNEYLSCWLVNHIIVEDRGIFKNNR